MKKNSSSRNEHKWQTAKEQGDQKLFARIAEWKQNPEVEEV